MYRKEHYLGAADDAQTKIALLTDALGMMVVGTTETDMLFVETSKTDMSEEIEDALRKQGVYLSAHPKAGTFYTTNMKFEGYWCEVLFTIESPEGTLIQSA